MCAADLVGDCNAAMAKETGDAIVQLLQLVHAEMPGAHIVSMALLPKGEVWPNRCSDAITAVNAQLEVRSRAFTAVLRPPLIFGSWHDTHMLHLVTLPLQEPEMCWKAFLHAAERVPCVSGHGSGA